MRRHSVPAVVIAILLQALPLTAWSRTDSETVSKVTPKPTASPTDYTKLMADVRSMSEQLKKYQAEQEEKKRAALAQVHPLPVPTAEAEDEEDESTESRTAAASASGGSSSREDEPMFTELNMEAARQALGPSFKLIQKDGKFILMGVTTRECFSDQVEDRKFDILVKGNDIKIIAAPPCDTLQRLSPANKVDLAHEIDLSSLNPKDEVCLVTELLDRSGDEARKCEKLYAGEKERLEEEQRLSAIQAEEASERKRAIAEAAEAVVIQCGRSNRPEDLLTALDPKIMELAQDVLGEGRTNAVYDLALAKLSRNGALDKPEHQGVATDVIEKIRAQTQAKDGKILKLKMAMAEKAIFGEADLTLEERQAILEEQVDLLRDANLEVDEKLIDRFEAAAKRRLVLTKVNEDVPAVKKAAYDAILKGDVAGLQKAQRALGESFKALGCKPDGSSAEMECQQLAAMNQQLILTNSQVAMANNLDAQCKLQQKQDPKAKCEQFAEHLKQMSTNPMVHDMGIRLPQSQQAQQPVDLSPKSPGTNGVINAATNPQTNTGFDLSMGSDASRNFFQPTQQMNAAGSPQPAANQNLQSSPGNSAGSAPQVPPAPPAGRTLIRR